MTLPLRLLAASALACLPFALDAQEAPVDREVVGTRTSENIPPIPAELLDRLNRYQNTRSANVADWTADGCLLVSTRFAETSQVHRVCEPMGMREQLTFYPEPVAGVVAAPSGHNGFVFAKDTGGDEFSQLSWFDLDTREATLLTDGKRSQNRGALFSHDGRQLAYSSTSRNGTDTDVWVRDMATGEARIVVDAGGMWFAQDFSPDGQRLLVTRYASINESYPGEVDLRTGELTLFPVDGGKAAFGGFRYAPDGESAYFVSDEPIDGRPSEFMTLRHHDPRTGALRELSGHIPWDVEMFTISPDGGHLAYVTNEDGIHRLHMLSLPSHQEVPLPALPVGLVGGLEFPADGKRLALTLNSATSPSDAYVIGLDDRSLVRWTRSEVGGLDPEQFVAPTLIRYPTFDEVDGQPRTFVLRKQ